MPEIPEQPKPRRVTHGMQSVYIGSDGIKRELNLMWLEDDAVAFEFRTWWNGEDKEPLESHLSLGIEAFNRLSRMISAFQFNRERYSLPAREPSPAAE